ncbi:MAG: site-2 protease family protein [Planctomycetes bacterium]|nr:site-2 protease family protein [Planctomycetota bacterium]
MENPIQFLAMGMTWYVVLLFTITLHEAAHSWMSMQLGDYTAHAGGQVSLNPLPHIKRSQFGLVVLPMLSFIFNHGTWMFGMASAPYDPNWANRYPKRAAAMAAAGPGSNLLLMLFVGVLIRFGLAIGIFAPPASISASTVVIPAAGYSGGVAALAVILSIAFTLNLILGIFNLIPIPPLDGSGIIPAFMSHEAAMKYHRFMWEPTTSVIGLLVAWHIAGRIINPAHLAALNILYYPMVSYGVNN